MKFPGGHIGQVKLKPAHGNGVCPRWFTQKKTAPKGAVKLFKLLPVYSPGLWCTLA